MESILSAYIDYVKEIKDQVIESEILLGSFGQLMFEMVIGAYIERIIIHCYVIAKKRKEFKTTDLKFLEQSFKNSIADPAPKIVPRDVERKTTLKMLYEGIDKDIKTTQIFISKNEDFIKPRTAHEAIGKLNAINDFLKAVSTEEIQEAYISFIETFGKEGKKLMYALLYLRPDIKDAKTYRNRYDEETTKPHDA